MLSSYDRLHTDQQCFSQVASSKESMRMAKLGRLKAKYSNYIVEDNVFIVCENENNFLGWHFYS